MGRENHIFVVVPKAEVETDLDWPACARSHLSAVAQAGADRRLPVFEAGKYLIAFDGLPTALRRRQARRCFFWRSGESCNEAWWVGTRSGTLRRGAILAILMAIIVGEEYA